MIMEEQEVKEAKEAEERPRPMDCDLEQASDQISGKAKANRRIPSFVGCARG
jgi:hypothetical protein